jgi:hypothetical protein
MGPYVGKLQSMYDIHQCLLDILTYTPAITRWFKEENKDLGVVPKLMMKDSFSYFQLRSYVECLAEF